MRAVMALSGQKGWRHFFYGGADGTAQALQEKLVERFPKLRIVGTYQPPFRPLNAEEQATLEETIRRTRPDMIWVGLSTPKQERFMAENLPKLDVTLMFGVGAAFDFLAGKVRQTPRWMQRSGLNGSSASAASQGGYGNAISRTTRFFSRGFSASLPA